jgi:DNA-binding response OmpR family regulator
MGSDCPLTGRSILVVEDEPLIALDIAEGFRAAGAAVFTAHNLVDGLRLAGHPDLSAAVLDFGLSDGDGTALCQRLKERGIPFLLHTGYQHVHAACSTAMLVPKPAAPSQLVSAIEGLISGG